MLGVTQINMTSEKWKLDSSTPIASSDQIEWQKKKRKKKQES